MTQIKLPPTNSGLFISYVFEASVPISEETDDRTFEGAAKLEIIVGSQDTILKGTYWTNRAWHRG